MCNASAAHPGRLLGLNACAPTEQAFTPPTQCVKPSTRVAVVTHVPFLAAHRVDCYSTHKALICSTAFIESVQAVRTPGIHDNSAKRLQYSTSKTPLLCSHTPGIINGAPEPQAEHCQSNCTSSSHTELLFPIIIALVVLLRSLLRTSVRTTSST